MTSLIKYRTYWSYDQLYWMKSYFDKDVCDNLFIWLIISKRIDQRFISIAKLINNKTDNRKEKSKLRKNFHMLHFIYLIVNRYFYKQNNKFIKIFCFLFVYFLVCCCCCCWFKIEDVVVAVGCTLNCEYACRIAAVVSTAVVFNVDWNKFGGGGGGIG